MSLLSAFLEALAGDPPKPIVKPTAAEFPDGNASRAFMAARRERRQMTIRAAAFEQALRARGASERELANIVKLYDGALKAQVKRA